MNMNYRRIIGRKLVLGFDGTTLPESFVQLVREYQVGNVVLFRRNIEDGTKLRSLCRDIQLLVSEVTGAPAFITIDEEGGLVSRLGADAVHVPCAMGVAATDRIANIETAAQIVARQLAGAGVNFNLAPVLDVNSNPANPVIGERSYGDDPQLVAAYGAAAVRGFKGTGVLCIGKHFPGHGDTAVDSHIGLPTVDKSLAELENCELIPFRAAIEAGIPAIMTSHILFPQLEPDGVPATMSRRILTGLLRERLGFDGLIMTDCLHMDAIRRYYGTAQGAVAAVKAGADLLIIASDEAEQREAIEALLAAAEAGEFSDKELLASESRILHALGDALVLPEPELWARPEDEIRAQELSREALVQVRPYGFTPGEGTFFCGPADYRAALVANPAGETSDFAPVLQEAFGGTSAICSRSPEEAEIEQIVSLAADAENIVLGTCNAHLNPGQLRLAEALAATGKPLLVVVLRNPYDVPLLPEEAGIICIWDYDAHALSALIDALRVPCFPGRMPVLLRSDAVYCSK